MALPPRGSKAFLDAMTFIFLLLLPRSTNYFASFLFLFSLSFCACLPTKLGTAIFLQLCHGASNEKFSGVPDTMDFCLQLSPDTILLLFSLLSPHFLSVSPTHDMEMVILRLCRGAPGEESSGAFVSMAPSPSTNVFFTIPAFLFCDAPPFLH